VTWYGGSWWRNRNVATLIGNPKGQVGRPSRSLTLEQSLALLEAARESRLNAYVVLGLAVGIRTEEARELHWDHVDLDGDQGAARPVPPSVAVWHSVRQGGDTKTAKSRRTLAVPQAACWPSESTASGRPKTGWRPGPCGRITAWSSLRPSGRP
jgi:integrase